ncbi:hypothetical protein MM239_04215 [Belliella sp. DSM 111904]|uniref:NIPSNAP protein n=1 Tax=Belliella filtrata TaxID=2923435 RepID=A0ABS9UWR4_9BACT|nr:hypothetical protein [Belliella filtrata]MCH7408587.1 hypothetical protein [Belliella filtrata]
MKKFLMIIVFVPIFNFTLLAQQNKYLVFEFIKVESSEMYDFIAYKDFMEKVYQSAISDKRISGWDFWVIQSGAEPGEFQYITVTYYDDPVKMMDGIANEDLVKYGRIGFPHMNENQIKEMIKKSQSAFDLTQRTYMKQIANSNDDFKYKNGVLASFDLMKAVENNFQEYETAEKEVFLPIHQNKIEKGLMGSWVLLRTALPFGSEAKSTHLTMNLYKDYVQFFNAQEYEDMESTAEEKAKIESGLKSRDQKWVYLARLEGAVR